MRYEISEHDQLPLIESFVESFQRATGAKVLDRKYEVPCHDGNVDLLLKIATPSGTWEMPIELKRVVYPRDVRQAVWVLDGYRSAPTDNAIVPMLLAEQLSYGAREELIRRGIGFYDASGSLYLHHDKWLVNIDRKPKTSPKQRTISLFTGSREMVIHALLQSKGDWLTGLALSELSKTSSFTVSTVLQELERLEWVESEGKGRQLRRRLSKPGDLLDAWVEAWQKRKENKTKWYFFCPKPGQLLNQISYRAEAAGYDIEWAITGAIAANAISPLLTQTNTAELQVTPGRIEEMAHIIGLKPAEKGTNVVLIERSGSSMLFRQRLEGYEGWFASPFVQYLDLLDGRGRNAELAAQFRQDILKV
ncbi:type IV toxin-antitoxin system AbiEi family antitoxin [Pseudomonas sp. CF161]|uniref:type IV toxin-antitoxin system AbiEi family antitoxin n=1 Tax=Pseudomonas sp. CF161 TaxID=911241 RepID=UPI000355435A|nr:type IV toxin-antitoxin system AbiEi family antitoxin [Pseudomonas sp. CF161]EPL15418.1 hypothetical protein CF161_03673 [Pseudomonas sp. CF161]